MLIGDEALKCGHVVCPDVRDLFRRDRRALLGRLCGLDPAAMGGTSDSAGEGAADQIALQSVGVYFAVHNEIGQGPQQRAADGTSGGSAGRMLPRGATAAGYSRKQERAKSESGDGGNGWLRHGCCSGYCFVPT